MKDEIDDEALLAGMQKLVDDGLAEWVEIEGEVGLRLTKEGHAHAASLRKDTVQ